MSSVIDGIGYDINGGEAWVRSLERSAPWVVIPPVVMQGGKDIPVTRICKSAFRKQHCLEKVIIGKRAFKDCTSLEAIAIPDFVTSIGVNAFRNCGNLKSVRLPKFLTEIKEDTFWNCTSLEAIAMPDFVMSIGVNAFRNCGNLKSVRLPKFLTEIKKEAFLNCTSLEAIAIPDFVTSIGVNAFRNCEIKNVHFSKKFASRPDRDDLFNALFYAGLRTREVLLRIPTK